MAVIRTKHYEFELSILDKIRRWQLDTLDGFIYKLGRDSHNWKRLLEEGKPYYASTGIIVPKDEFKNILDEAFKRVGYDKVDRLLYKFTRQDNRWIATITLKGEGTEAIYEVYIMKEIK